MLYWIWLSKLSGIGPVLQRELLKEFKSPEKIYHASFDELLSFSGLGQEKAKAILNSRSLETAKDIFDKAQKHNIKLLTFDNPLYPVEAKSVLDSPVLLYYKGQIKEDSMGVGIIGSRRCSEYGKRVITETSSYLAKEGITVISGMAKGIDSYAHTVCLKAGGYTIAFLGNGLDRCYPSEHKGLMEKIIDHGAVISEYEPGILPVSTNFPKRNRLISAWSHKLLVVEAGLKSGTLITADFALKHGRELLAVPGEIHKAESMGCNHLIAKGAKIYLEASQLLLRKSQLPVEKGMIKKQIKQKTSEYIENLSDLDVTVLQILREKSEVTIGELSTILKVDEMTLLECAIILELNGKISLRGDRLLLIEGQAL